MRKTKISLASLLVCAVALNLSAADQSEFESTLTKIGQQVPEFDWTTLDGQKFDTKMLHGKVVLVNFFATWCGPCMEEIPHLQKDIFQKFKDKNFVMVSIGREHNDAELKKFQKKREFTIPLAADPERKIYSRFATQYIPRNYVIAADGKIAFQSVGYNQEEFKQMLDVIDKELKKAGAK
jgi:peroxiredoxin